MFGNLKNKLGDAADLKKYASPQVLSSLGSSRQRSHQHTPGSGTPSGTLKHSRQASITSLQAVGGAPADSSNQDKFQFPEKDFSSLEKEIVKLKNNLESQQDAAVHKLEAKEVEWRKKLDDSHKKFFALESELKQYKEREKTMKLHLKDNEKKCLEKSAELMISHEKYKDIEKRLYNLQENYDQMEGLSTQETAKIKHLLLNTNSEFEEAKKELNEKNKQIDDLQKQLSHFGHLEERVALFSEEKMELETQLAGFQQKLNTCNQRLSTSEELHSDELKHLKEKIFMLESRSSQECLEETEKIKLLMKERKDVEHKLEETRQQLNNIKSSWCEKISLLESQIKNLNEKISEDQIDLKSSEETIRNLRKETENYKNNLQDNDQKNNLKINSLEEKISKLQEDLESEKWDYQNTISEKDKETKELRKKLHIEESRRNEHEESFKLKENVIEQLRRQCSEKDEELSNLRRHHGTLQADFSSLVSSNNSLQESFSSERNQRNSLEKELEIVAGKLSTVTEERNKLSSNLDIYFSKTEKQEEEVVHLKAQIEEKAEEIDSLKKDLERERVISLKAEETLRGLEDEFDAKVEESTLVKELREKLKNLEDDINDKKQMLKVQGQRLADMKKTFQREFKINPDVLEAADILKGNSGQLSPKPRSPSDNAGSAPNSPRPSQSTCNGEIEIDSINLKYLKHVVLKFVTSREYEAVQLTKAIATLLHMSPTEENLLKETLEWKMSWFRSRPNLGSGQNAKVIPPSV